MLESSLNHSGQLHCCMALLAMCIVASMVASEQHSLCHETTRKVLLVLELTAGTSTST